MKEQGVAVELEWKGPMKEDDRDSQIKVMEGFIAAGVDGIVLAPLDDKALRGVVRERHGTKHADASPPAP